MCVCVCVCVCVWLAGSFPLQYFVGEPWLQKLLCGTCPMSCCNGFDLLSSTDCRHDVKQARYCKDCKTSAYWSTHLRCPGFPLCLQCRQYTVKQWHSYTQTNDFLWYLKKSSPKDLECHGEGEAGTLPTLSQVVEGRLAYHCPHPGVLLTFTMSWWTNGLMGVGNRCRHM